MENRFLIWWLHSIVLGFVRTIISSILMDFDYSSRLLLEHSPYPRKKSHDIKQPRMLLDGPQCVNTIYVLILIISLLFVEIWSDLLGCTSIFSKFPCEGYMVFFSNQAHWEYLTVWRWSCERIQFDGELFFLRRNRILIYVFIIFEVMAEWFQRLRLSRKSEIKCVPASINIWSSDDSASKILSRYIATRMAISNGKLFSIVENARMQSFPISESAMNSLKICATSIDICFAYGKYTRRTRVIIFLFWYESPSNGAMIRGKR